MDQYALIKLKGRFGSVGKKRESQVKDKKVYKTLTICLHYALEITRRATVRFAALRGEGCDAVSKKAQWQRVEDVVHSAETTS